MFLYKKQVKTRSKVELWDSPMYDYLHQCAKYNLNLLHILKLTDFLQNVLLKKKNPKKNICLQGCHYCIN